MLAHILRRTVWLILILVASLLLLRAHADAQATDTDSASIVYVLTFEGPVTPVLEQYLADAIDTAQLADAEAVILQLDTPGGSVDVTRSITQLLLGSPVPVIVYVAPSGARAGSAGTFIVLAGHVAAMAPGTSIGAASPVDLSGAEINETMQAKVENLLSADVENLASRRGDEAIDWAISAVRDASAATAAQALELGVVDVIAVDVDSLLQEIDSMEVIVNGETQVLRTANTVQQSVELTLIQSLLNLISNPTIATLLLSLGMIGIFVEIRSPGFGVPGIVGVISLLLAFFGLGQIDANLVGMALMAAAMVLFVAEAFTPTFGLLATGGVAAFILGAALLFDSSGIRPPWLTIITVAIAMGVFVVFAGAKAFAAQKKKPVTGEEGLVGAVGKVKNAFTSEETGAVFVQGEWWNARVENGELLAGDRVRVISREGYTVWVEKLPEQETVPPAPISAS